MSYMTEEDGYYQDIVFTCRKEVERLCDVIVAKDRDLAALRARVKVLESLIFRAENVLVLNDRQVEEDCGTYDNLMADIATALAPSEPPTLRCMCAGDLDNECIVSQHDAGCPFAKEADRG
jgi:hypothetical protein